MGVRISHRDLNALAPLPWPRVQVAAHELGHWLVWKTVPGIRVVDVKIWGSANNPQGHAHVNWDNTSSDIAIDKLYLIGLLAGVEADKLWASATKTSRLRGGSGHDMSAFRTFRRKCPDITQWSENHLRSCAHGHLTRNWSELVAHVERLARTGRL